MIQKSISINPARLDVWRRLWIVQLLLLVLSALFTTSAEARKVEIKYYGSVWPYEAKEAIQFLSPMKGWVGIRGVPAYSYGKPTQPYLLTTNRGPENLHPVENLKLPEDHVLDSFFFLDAEHGWVVISEIGWEPGKTRLYRTEDGGESWQELNHNLPPAPGGGLIQFLTPSLGWLMRGKLWRTEDGGTSWREISVPATGNCFFLDPLTGWIAGNGVIWHTRDGGNTWKVQYDAAKKHGPEARPVFWGMQFLTAAEGWIAGDGQYLLHTTNAGNTWHEVRVKNPKVGLFDSFESVHFLNPRVGVVSGEHNKADEYSAAARRHMSPLALYYYRPYLLITCDGGRTWKYRDLPVPIGKWSQAGPSLLYGINTMHAVPEDAGIIELHISDASTNKR